MGTLINEQGEGFLEAGDAYWAVLKKTDGLYWRDFNGDGERRVSMAALERIRGHVGMPVCELYPAEVWRAHKKVWSWVPLAREYYKSCLKEGVYEWLRGGAIAARGVSWSFDAKADIRTIGTIMRIYPANILLGLSGESAMPTWPVVARVRAGAVFFWRLFEGAHRDLQRVCAEFAGVWVGG